MSTSKINIAFGYSDIPPGHVASVVTCLEMRQKPQTDAAPLPEGITLEHFAGDDLATYRTLFWQPMLDGISYYGHPGCFCLFRIVLVLSGQFFYLPAPTLTERRVSNRSVQSRGRDVAKNKEQVQVSIGDFCAMCQLKLKVSLKLSHLSSIIAI